MKKQLLKKSLLSVLALAFTTTTINAQVPTPDLLHYKFDGTGATVTNYATSPPPSATVGTIVGAQTQTGVIGCMPALVGTGASSGTDYVNTGWTPSLTGSWSISFWTSNIQPSSTLWYIFGESGTSFRCFTNGVAGPNNWILRGTGITDVLISNAATTTSNMVTYVYDQTAGNIVGYKDGVATVTVVQAGSITLNGTTPFKVGAYASSTGLSPLGLMGDFRIYTSALTPAQVLALYNATNPITPTLSVVGSNSICAGNSAVLTGSGAVTYTWSTGSNSVSISTSPSVTTTYTLMGANTTCSATPVTFTVNVNALPTVSLTASMYTTCVNAGTISLTGSPAGGVYTGTNVAGNVFTPGTNAGTYTAVYSYTDSSTGCTNSTSTNIVVDLCTGITNYLAETNGIQITPNPNAGNFTIEFRNESEKSIEIVNILGQSVKTVITSEKAVRFDINNLPSGTYYAIIKMNNNVTTTKLIKQ